MRGIKKICIMVQVWLIEKVVFEQNASAGKVARHTDPHKRMFQVEAIVIAKAPRWMHARCI